MNEPVYMVEIDKTTRAVAYQDNHADSPREWAEDVSVYTIALNRHYLAPYAGVNDLESILTEKQENLAGQNIERDDLKDVMLDNKRNFRIVQMNVYRDWVGDFIYYGNDETVSQEFIDYHIQEMRAYYDGRVYIVGVEKLVTYTSETGKTIDQWEMVDSPYGSVYFEGDESIEDEMLRIAGEISE